MNAVFEWVVAWIVEVFNRAQVDLAVTVLGVLIAFILREKIWMWIRWGRWQVVIKNSEDPDPDKRELTRRKLSPERARLVLKDPNEMSVFVKGVANPHGPRILLDPVSKESRDIGFLTVKRKVIALDYAHNPKPEAKPRVLDSLPARIDLNTQKLDQALSKVEVLATEVGAGYGSLNARIDALQEVLTDLNTSLASNLSKQTPVPTADPNVEQRDKHV